MYRSSAHDRAACPPERRCRPGKPGRWVPRSIHEGARDVARDIARTGACAAPGRQREGAEVLFARPKRTPRLGRPRPRGPSGARDEFRLAAAAARNLRGLARPIPAPVPSA